MLQREIINYGLRRPFCRKEECSQYDAGLVFKEIASYSDQAILKFIEYAWKPGKLFDFPSSVECSNFNRHFVWSWLTVKDFSG